MKQYSTPDAQDATVIIPVGQPFVTHWIIVQDEQEAAWTFTPVGQRAAYEAQHPWTALDTYDDATLARYCITLAEVADPPPPVPYEVSAMQAQIFLERQNLLAPVQAAITSAGGEVAIYWNKAGTFHRDHPALEGIAQALGWSGDQLDDFFRAAAQIT